MLPGYLHLQGLHHGRAPLLKPFLDAARYLHFWPVLRIFHSHSAGTPQGPSAGAGQVSAGAPGLSASPGQLKRGVLTPSIQILETNPHPDYVLAPLHYIRSLKTELKWSVNAWSFKRKIKLY